MYHSLKINYINIATGSLAEHIDLVKNALDESPKTVIFACTDCAMQVYSAAVAIINQEIYKDKECNGSPCSRINLKGAFMNYCFD